MIAFAAVFAFASSAIAETNGSETLWARKSDQGALRAEAPVQLAQSEFRRRFVPTEDPVSGDRRWVETPGGAESAPSYVEPPSIQPEASPSSATPTFAEPEPVTTPEPRRIPLSPAARAASGVKRTGKPRCDIPTCAARYKSFNAYDCTYQPFEGPRVLCRRGNPNSASAVAAWRRLGSPEADAKRREQKQAARLAAARAELARTGAESRAAHIDGVQAPLKASASVSRDGEALLDWFDLVVIAAFIGFCIHAFVQLWSSPWRERV